MRTLFTLAALLLIVLPAAADTIYIPFDQPTIQQGINAAVNGDEVVVSDGTYTGSGNVHLNFQGKAITVRSSNGPRHCIIDMENASRGAYFNQGEGPDSVLQGFTLRNGQAPKGGGILVSGWASPTIRGNILEYCHADENGGAIFVRVGSPVITDNLIQHNEAAVGGGIWLNHSWAVVTSNRFMYNSATNEGGGLRCTWSMPEIANNLFHGNHAGTKGGAIHLTVPYNFTGTYTLASNTVDSNTSDGGCGGLFCRGCRVEVIDSIFSANSGYDIQVGDASAAASMHIAYSNIYQGIDQIFKQPGSVLTFGGGVFNQYPQYVHGPLGNHYLRPSSFCVDAGSNDAVNICFTGADGPVCMDELTTSASELLEYGTVDLGYHFPVQTLSPRTLKGLLATTPPAGYLPVYTRFWLLIRQETSPAVNRTAAFTIGLRTAGGQYYPNWRSGTASLVEGEDFLELWVLTLPDIWSFAGENTFQLRVEDITPPPYNLPPYQPSGGTDINTFTFYGIASGDEAIGN